MKIDDNHLYHGAALIQIAEHPEFTAINTLKTKRKKFENAYEINTNISVYLKYANEPKKPFKEYVFTFKKDHLSELNLISKENQKTFIALVCVKDREICCISYEELMALIAKRRGAARKPEDQYTVLVVIPKGKRLRAYMNAPNVKKTKLGELIVKRIAFPNKIFER